MSKAFFYVRDKVRYSAVYLGQGGYLPVACGRVNQEQKGDCKGMAVLLAALLRARGMEAGVALAATRHRIKVDPTAPSLAQFNHMITWVNVGKTGPIYLDATDKAGSPNYLPWTVRTNPLLVIRGGGKSALRPSARGGRHVYRIRGPCARPPVAKRSRWTSRPRATPLLI